MKSPEELKKLLRRQWESAAHREARLLGPLPAWPLTLSIGRPSPRMLRDQLDVVKRHVETWRKIRFGEVIWKEIPYRHTADPVLVPFQWRLRKPSEWIDAIHDAKIRQQFESMSTLVEHTDAIFHTHWIRRRSLWMDKPIDEVVQAARLSMTLVPGCAQGKPLRLISWEGIDTKFFERHSSLITGLLDIRFEGEVSRLGLETFLHALREEDHWLLLVDLDGQLLPFKKLRVRSRELQQTPLPGANLLIVENETCQHLLPKLQNTIAVLGAGFDLSWTEAAWLVTRRVAYWGDIDTWGMQFLARVRMAVPHLDALLMSSEVYDPFASAAVREPVIADTQPPLGLHPAETALYLRLLKEDRGRLEQEFLPADLCQQALVMWASRRAPDDEP